MKNSILITLIFTTLTFQGYTQLKISSTGKVGINNLSPSYYLDLNGNFNFEQTGSSRIVTSNGKRIIFHNSEVYTDNNANLGAYGYTTMWNLLYARKAYFSYNPIILSDKKFKTEIKDLDKTLSQLIKLRPVKYKLNHKKRFSDSEKAYVSTSSEENVSHIGLIAQEVQEIVPEIVSLGENNYLGIRYTELVPLLIKGIQEQQEKIEELKTISKILENNCCYNGETLKSDIIGNKELNDAKLYSNNPNSIQKQTIIRFDIPESVQKAELYIFDIKGKLLKSERINSFGNGSIKIADNELAAGKYLYSLVCDGTIVSTKKMLLIQ